VVLLGAAGKHFCAGHLLDEMVDRGAAAYRTIFENCTAMMTRLRELPQPVVAQVQGVSTAAGCQLVAASDLAVASASARFATPGVRLGLFCSTPAVPLVRAVGRKRALEMLLTGRWVSAAEALEWGLVNKVVAVEDLAAEAEKLARQVATASPLTLALGKKTFYDQLERPEPEAFKVATANMALNLCMEDAQQGIKAFLAKREPDWQGR
jgi:enoyl-CoA hydratase/carnithine racemase